MEIVSTLLAEADTSLPSTMKSYSAADEVKDLLPVSLDDKDLAEDYSKLFFPQSNFLRPGGMKNPANASVIVPDYYFRLAKHLGNVAAYLNGVRGAIRDMYISASNLELDGADAASKLQARFASYRNKVAPDEMAIYVKTFVESMNSGTQHIIIPSEKYKGGFDIIFSGIPQSAGVGAIPGALNFRKFKADKVYPYTDGSSFEKDNEALKAGKCANEMIAFFYKQLFSGDATSLPSSSKRVMGMLELKDRYEELAAGLQKIFGKTYSGTSISDMLKFTAGNDGNDAARAFSKYISILIIREPTKEAIDAVYNDPAADLTKFKLSPQSLAFDSDIVISFVLHIPKEICEFITQTKNKQVPMVPLNTWVGTWAKAMLKMPKMKNTGGFKITPQNAPRYVISASGMKDFVDRRKKLGYYTEPGRTNDEGIYIANNGRMNWCPKTDDLVLDNARNYEKMMEEALSLSFAAGSPIAMTQKGVTSKVFALQSKDYAAKIGTIKQKLMTYAGSLQAYNWDYNCALSSQMESPDKLRVMRLDGAVKADARSAFEYLSQPILQSVLTMFPGMTDETGEEVEDLNKIAYKPSNIKHLSVFKAFIKAYAYLLYDKKVPDLQQLVTEAAKEIKLTSLDPATAVDDDSPVNFERNLYTNWMGLDIKVLADYTEDPQTTRTSGRHNAEYQAQAIVDILAKVMDDAAGIPGSNLARLMAKTGADLSESPRYLNMGFANLKDISNVYLYLGGMIFCKAVQAFQKSGTKALLVINPDNPLPSVPFPILSEYVMPLVVMFGKYIPDYEEIAKKSEEFTALTKPDDNITEEDIHVPGSGEGFQMFPHQIEAMKALLHHPKYAVLDIAPGGGKTILLLTDIANLIHKGMVKRACVICPNNLIKNWIEDMHKVTGGKWNMIPLSRETYETWGPERLGKIVENAPVNTIYVIGMRFFQVDRYPIVIGSHAEQVSGALEFIRKYEFDYICIDESQRVKNAQTRFHKTTKQVCTASCVKYIRIASGSLIQNQLDDVVGQAAMFSSQIFRTRKEYMKENQELAAGGSKAMVLKKDAEVKARQQFAKFCAVVTFKRKDWAFLLPSPIESFLSVSLDKSDALDANGQPRDRDFVDPRMANAHQLMYDAILNRTLDEIKSDKDVMKILGKTDGKSKPDDKDGAADGSVEDEGDDEKEDSSSDLLDASGDLSDDVLQELEGLLRPYLQRLEQCLSAPLKDEFGSEYFKGLDAEKFVSNKVIMAIKRMKLNFEKMPWVKGKVYQERDLCDLGDVRYVLMGSEEHPLSVPTHGTKKELRSDLPPNKDSAWKIEPAGKVIVFCRYKNTVDAIYAALPENLKAIAVRFHSGIPGRYKNLDRFKSEPYSTTTGAQILIANEQAISEGHNLQMASRLIRMESPWAPGELDQAQSRIFRPDPSGKFTRENVYLDWVLAAGTMEVAKFARLISKIISKAKFDEADNPRYNSIKDYQIPVIRMSLDTIRAMPQLSDFMESHIEPYQMFKQVESEEFREMRLKKNTKMMPIPQTPMMKDARILEQVPYLPNLKVPDRHDYGLINLSDYLKLDDPVAIKLLATRGVKGLYVHTEFGNGTIVGTTSTRGNAEDPSGINKVKVELANGDILDLLPVTQVFVATKLTEATVKQFSPKKTLIGKNDKGKAKLTKAEVAAKLAAEKEQLRLKKAQQRELKGFDRLKKLDKLKKNVRAGKKPLDEVEVRKTKTKTKSEAEVNMHIDLYPVIYNGFWALEAVVHDEGAISLEDYGFAAYGEYLSCVVKDHQAFVAIDDYLQKKFVLSAQTNKHFDELNESFQGRSKKFVASIYSTAELKNFYTLSHRPAGVDKASGLPIIKVYPAIMNNGLLLNIDIATNPKAKAALLNKVIPKTNARFVDVDGLHIRFFKNRTELLAAVKELKADGAIITDEANMLNEVESIKTKMAVNK